MSPLLVPISFFIFLFAIFYLYFSTRNRERMALIEKGADASIFMKGKQEGTSPIWKILLLNLALLLMAIGLAIFIGSIMVNNLNVNEGVAFPGSIFLMAGISLLVGFFLTKKMDKEA